MAKPMPRPSAARRLVARIRMPLLAVAFVAFVAGLMFGASPAVTSAILVVFVLALALYLRLGTPAGPTVDLAGPVTGRWVALNSPSTRVPSHMLHGWAQTYAVDLVCDPDDGSRPGMSWTPLARRARDFPGFGRPVRAPIAGTVVRRRDGWRDHWSRTSPPGLAYLMLERVRELIGPSGILGNHVVIEGDDARTWRSPTSAGARCASGGATASWTASRSPSAATRATRANRTCTSRRWTAQACGSRRPSRSASTVPTRRPTARRWW